MYTVLLFGTTIMLKEYLGKLGLGEKEQSLYVALARLGVQPASVVARTLEMDRVVAYKHLKKMESMGLVKVYMREGMQVFRITGAEGLASYLQERTEDIATLAQEIPSLEPELRDLTQKGGVVPKVQIFQGKSGVRALFRDLLYEVKSERIQRMRMLTSNTFDQNLSPATLDAFTAAFFKDIQATGIAIDMLEASGTLIPEFVRRLDPETFDPSIFPAARGATNVFLVGTALYFACFGDALIGLKVKQEQMSQIFHFFFDCIGKNLPRPEYRRPRNPEEWLAHTPQAP